MKLLFCGFQHGHILGLYEKAKNNADVEIVACIEEDEKRKAALADKIPFDSGAYEEWLKKDVDIVAVGGKYGQRGEMVIKALKAGKHVIADKPICTRIEELEEIEALAREKGLKVACMFDLRYTPSTLTAKRLIAEKELGEVCNISFTGQHCIDYGNRPTWYFEEGMHGGTLNDLSIHGLDLVEFMTGLTIRKVNAARCWNCYATRHPEFKDCAMFLAELSNGGGLVADVSYSAPTQVFSMPTYWDFKIWCEKGLLTFAATQNKVTLYKEGVPAPIVLEETPVCSDWLQDLIAEIRSGANTFTESVFRTSRQALNLQKASE